MRTFYIETHCPGSIIFNKHNTNQSYCNIHNFTSILGILLNFIDNNSHFDIVNTASRCIKCNFNYNLCIIFMSLSSILSGIFNIAFKNYLYLTYKINNSNYIEDINSQFYLKQKFIYIEDMLSHYYNINNFVYISGKCYFSHQERILGYIPNKLKCLQNLF